MFRNFNIFNLIVLIDRMLIKKIPAVLYFFSLHFIFFVGIN